MRFEKGETQGAKLNAEGRLLTDRGDGRRSCHTNTTPDWSLHGDEDSERDGE